MHRKIAGRMANLVSLILGLAIALAGFLIQPVQAGLGTPIAVCAGQDCTITFEYSGAPYYWEPPLGATDIRFDLYGAQGGQGSRSTSAGGLGGRITGRLSITPTSLYVYVGGAGVRGAGASGGFNGGGYAGSGHGDEGSGGGATDLRASAALADRIAVAGGGGGTGGYNWSTAGLGGSGGDIYGTDGGWGQAAPGLGGSQYGGGSAGRSSGGSTGGSGGLGFGGRGGSSSFSGGGGGGGGYFGGGGGGADTVTCCFNGGGGGGGSSYAKSGSTSLVQHSSGVRVGAGIAYITYHWEPVVPTPTPTPSPTATATPTPSPTSTPTPTPTYAPTSMPTSEPTSSPDETPTPAPVPAPVSSPAPVPPAVPVPVVEHLPPTPPVTSVPPIALAPAPAPEPAPAANYEPIVEVSAPLPQPTESSGVQEALPVVIELVEHLAPLTTESVAFQLEPEAAFRPGMESENAALIFGSIDPGEPSANSNASASLTARAKLNQVPMTSAQNNASEQNPFGWQVPVAIFLLATGGFAVWRKSRRKTQPQFIRIS